MSEPDTNTMRATYATAATYRQSPDPSRAAEFDRWLAGVKAEAWEAGAQAQAAAYGMDKDTGPNPYGGDRHVDQ